MHAGMGGKHHFEVHISTNDPERSKLVFHIYANTLEPNAASADGPRPTHDGYYDLPVKGLMDAMPQKGFTLVNVHTPFEGRIKGTDLEIPYNEIDKALARLPKAKNSPIVLYCRSDRMSEIAARRLVELGYTRVFNVVGGMVAWEEAGYPLETK